MAAESPLPLSLDEHRELGSEIRNVTARLEELKKLVAAVYGANSMPAFDFTNAVEALEKLRDDMEVQAGRDLPGLHVDGLYR